MEEGVKYEEKSSKQIFVGGGGHFTNKETKTPKNNTFFTFFPPDLQNP